MCWKVPDPWNGEGGLSIHTNSSQLRMDGSAIEMWHYKVLDTIANLKSRFWEIVVDGGVAGAYIASGAKRTSLKTKSNDVALLFWVSEWGTDLSQH